MKRSALLAALAVCCAIVFGAASAQGDVSPPLTPGHYLGFLQAGSTGDGGPLTLDLRAPAATPRALAGVLSAAGRDIPVAVALTSPDTFVGTGRTPAATLDFRGSSVDWFDRGDFRVQTDGGTTTGRLLFFRTFDNPAAPALPAKWEISDPDAVTGGLVIGGQSGNEFRGTLGIGAQRFPLLGSIGALTTDGWAPVHAVSLSDDGALTLQGRLARTAAGPRLACEVAAVLADGSVRTARFVLVPAVQ